jgi:hypothetical protein
VPEHLTRTVDDADVHRLHVQIDPAVIRVLSVVESHLSSSCATCAFAPLAAERQDEAEAVKVSASERGAVADIAIRNATVDDSERIAPVL